jgi:hypothetical protein
MKTILTRHTIQGKIEVFLQKTFILLIFFHLTGCSSYDHFKNVTRDYELPSQVFKASYEMTWSAIKNVIDTYNYSLEVSNRASGLWKTRWVDNALEMNFSNSLNRGSGYKASKFKLIINVVKGYRTDREVTKVFISKRQLVQKDLLQGWKVIHSDQILEKTLLYRLKRILLIEKKLEQLERRKSKEVEEIAF